MTSRKCEHGMMPWECSYCDGIEKTEEARKYRNSIIDECIEAVKPENIYHSYSESVGMALIDAMQELEQLKK